MPGVQIGSDIYEEVEDEYRIAVVYLLKIRDKLGITDETQLEGSVKNSSSKNNIILRYALEIYRTWAALYPYERHEFIEKTIEELKYERSIKESLKAGGYSPASFPMRLDALYGLLIPGVKIQDKRFWKPLFLSIPEIKRSNYA